MLQTLRTCIPITRELVTRHYSHQHTQQLNIPQYTCQQLGYGDYTHDIFNITYDKHGDIANGDFIPLTCTTKQPVVKCFPIARSNTLHSLIMYEINSTNRQLVHWSIANISCGDVRSALTIIPYISPNPSSNKGLHAYMFCLFKQNTKYLGDPINTSTKVIPVAPLMDNLNISTLVAAKYFVSKYS